ncbi:MAG: penicillin-binding transpeptidase domain-containing protein, partial [Clostridiales bacterium]|nr:penicillin-binding transpeptidase domain-containing protein [Clostridiales bacterium]
MKGTRIKISTKLVMRSYILFAVIIAAFAFLAYKIFAIQTVNFDYYQQKVINQLTTESTVYSKRGSIYDSEGVQLATNISAYRIFIAPSNIRAAVSESTGDEAKNYDDIIARGLSEILGEKYGVTYETVAEMIEKKKGSLDATVVRLADGESADLVLDFISKNDLGNMVLVEATSKRYYAYGSVASHVLGFTGTDGAGLYGLEYQYNSQLAGTPGKYITARDSYGREMPYEYKSVIEAVDGYDMHTTLNLKLQMILEEQLKATFEECQPECGAAGLVMNVKTGAVLAMATYPDFDCNDARTLDSYYTGLLEGSGYTPGSAEYNLLKGELQTKMWSNKVLTDPYMPGSTFKIITTSMALEQDVAKVDEKFFCAGYLQVANRKIHCYHTSGHGSLTFGQGLQQSCNPVLMTVGMRVGQEKFYNYFREFGYLDKTGIDLPGEGKTTFWDESEFGIVDLAVASFGQNFQVSMLHHLTALSAVANNGYLMTPYIVEKMTDSEGNVVYSHQVESRRQVISASVSKTVSQILEEGVSGDGGAKNCYIPGYKIAAKTGTSEKIGDPDPLARIGSCVAYAPSDDPEIAILIVVDDPKIGSRFGSMIAAPYIANCLAQMLPYLGYEPEYTDAEKAALDVEVGEYRGRSPAVTRNLIKELGVECEIIG